MTKLTELKNHLKAGKVYRREDLTQWSKSVDRHLEALIQEGTLEKVFFGMYYYPEMSAVGAVPPSEDELVRSYLKDNRFLVLSPNLYNRLGVGTTQLYNTRTVYNNKRHGDVMFGNKKFSFQRKPHFPRKVTPEFLAVDLVNNLDKLAEDKQEVLQRLSTKLPSLNLKNLKRAVTRYGGARAKKFFRPLIEDN